MANVSFYLDARRLNREGKAEIKFAFRNANTTAYVGTGIFLEPAYWNGTEVVKAKDRAPLNSRLRIMLAKMTECLQQVAGLKSKQKAIVLRDRAVALYDGDKSQGETLLTLLDRHVHKRPRPAKTVESFEITAKKVKAFDKNADTLLVDDITEEWLWKFETWMQGKELATNTRAIQMENLRAVINYSNSIGLSTNLVFKRWKIKREESKKRALPFDELVKIWNYTAETPYEQLCIDIFKLQVCLCGINMIDLFSLTEKNIVGDRLEYTRTKTGVKVSIKLEPEALALINLHRGRTHLLCLADQCKDHKTFLDRYNRRLKLIGPTTYEGHSIVKREPLWPYLSSYYSRHTPATLLARMGCPINVIGMGVGHAVDKRNTTLIYIDPYRPQLDFFMRKMLDAITTGEMPKGNAMSEGLLQAIMAMIGQ